MPSKESQRVDEHRRANFDRVSILVDKGGRQLFRVLALREGVSMTEMIRRAVLARAGLRVLPYPDALEKLEGITTQEEARVAIRKLQMHEEADEIKTHIIDSLSAEPAKAEYITYMDHADMCEFDEAARRIDAAMEAADPENDMDLFSPPVAVKLKGREIGIMRRMLANIQLQDIESDK